MSRQSEAMGKRVRAFRGGLLMTKQTIKAKELLAPIRAGLDDAGLLKTHRFPKGGILKALNRLMWEGLTSPSELEERRSLAKTAYTPVFDCRSCGDAYSPGILTNFSSNG